MKVTLVSNGRLEINLTPTNPIDRAFLLELKGSMGKTNKPQVAMVSGIDEADPLTLTVFLERPVTVGAKGEIEG